MSMPSPFDIGQLIGNNFAPSIERQTDRSAIDNILSEISQEDEEGLNSAMAQIISRVSPKNQPLAAQILQNKMNNIALNRQQQQKREAFEKSGLPESYSDLPDSVVNKLIESDQKSLQNAEAKTIKDSENQERLQNLSKTFQSLESLIPSTGKVGRGFGSISPLEVTRRRSEFDTLALSLEKIAAGMVGKGTLSEQRFNFLKDRLPSSKYSQSKNEGILKAWKQELGITDFEERGKQEEAKNREASSSQQEKASSLIFGS